MKRATAFLTVIAFFFLALPAYTQELPEDPGKTPISESESWVYATIEKDQAKMAEGEVVCYKKSGSELKLVTAGILMSEAKATRCAKYKLAFDETLALYQVDLKTWPAKLDVYDTQLQACETRVTKLTKKAKPNWWERNDFTVGLILGMVISAGVVGLTVGLALK
jgi:hypothetical protein